MPDSRIVEYAMNVGAAVLNTQDDPMVLNPAEFSKLDDCICEGGVIRNRRRAMMVEWDQAVSGHSIYGLSTYRSATTGESWLVAAVGYGTTGQVKLYALLLERTNNNNVVTRRIQETVATKAPGLLWSFWTYRNTLWASNGFVLRGFDGRRWHGVDETEGTIAGRIGLESGRKFVLANTPTYGNEILWTDVMRDIKVSDVWTGNAPGGGTGVYVGLHGFWLEDGVFFAVGETGTAVKSDTGGRSWYKMIVPALASLNGIEMKTVGDYRQGFIVGSMSPTHPAENTVYRYLNETNGWTSVAPSVDSDFYAVLLARQTAGIAVCWIGGRQDASDAAIIYKTENGGQEIVTWEFVDHSGLGTNRIGAAVRCLDNYRGVDGSDDIMWAVGTHATSGRTYVYEWDPARGVNGQMDLKWPSAATYDFFAVSIANTLPSTVYVAGADVDSNGRIFKTADEGSTWTDVTPASPSLAGITIYGLAAPTANIAYAVGDLGTIIKTLDGGTSWVAQTSPVDYRLNRVHFTDVQTGYIVGDSGTFLTTTDGGDTWVRAGLDDDDPNKLINPFLLASGEEIRAKLANAGIVYFFTDRAIHAFHAGTMKPSFKVEGFETFNQNCVAEHNGGIYIFGQQDGVPGVYAWAGGNAAPQLVTAKVKDDLRAARVEAVPGGVSFVLDSEQDFTPVTGGPAFNTKYWRYDRGLLRCLQGASGQYFYSHGTHNGDNDPGEYDGDAFYVKDITDWGFISVELAYNHPSDPSKLGLQLRVRTGPDDGGVPDFSGLHDVWHTVKGQFEKTGQGDIPGRYVFRLSDHDADPDHPWLQFRLRATNNATEAVSFSINRIAIRATVNSDYAASPCAPSLVSFDGNLYAFYDTAALGGECLILAGPQMQASKMFVGRVNCAHVHGDELYMGRFNANDPEVLYLPEDNSDIGGVRELAQGQIIQTGAVNFSGGDPLIAATRKELQQIGVTIKPPPWAGSVAVKVEWAADNADAADWQSQTLIFDQRQDIENDQFRYRVIELQSPTGNVHNQGQQFFFRVKFYPPDVEPPTHRNEFVLVNFRVKAKLLPWQRPTDYEA